jgi:predicted outer membrane repeat protein
VATHKIKSLFGVGFAGLKLYNLTLAYIGPDTDPSASAATSLLPTSAIEVGDAGSLSMFGVTITDFPLGAIIVNTPIGSNLYLQDCVFNGNGRVNSSSAGAIQINPHPSTLSPFKTTFTMIDLVFSNNAAAYGGAIGIREGENMLEQLEMTWKTAGSFKFANNIADFNGGAISFDHVGGDSKINILLTEEYYDLSRWHFNNNTAGLEGGAISSPNAELFMGRGLRNPNPQSHSLNFNNNYAPKGSAFSVGARFKKVYWNVAYLSASGNSISPSNTFSLDQNMGGTLGGGYDSDGQDPDDHPSVFRFTQSAQWNLFVANSMEVRYNYGNIFHLETQVTIDTSYVSGSDSEFIEFNQGGSAIYISSQTSNSFGTSLWRCRGLEIRNNTAAFGGGIHARGPLQFLDYCYPTFSGNKARFGGAIYVNMPYFTHDVLNLSTTTNFAWNSATVNGGAIYAVDKMRSPTISPIVWHSFDGYHRVRFRYNQALQQGGAVFTNNYLLLQTLFRVTSEFEHNSAAQGCVFATRDSVSFFGNATCPYQNPNYTEPLYSDNFLLPGGPNFNPAFRCPFEDYSCHDPAHPPQSSKTRDI